MTLAKEKLDKLPAFAEELITIAEEVFRNRIKCADDDHMGVMAIAFSAKQAEHLISVQVLVGARRYSDAAIIARVMLEGMALLIWSWKAPKQRARDWRAYSLVFDLQTLRSKQAAGERVDQGVEEELLRRLAEEGSQFLKKGGDPVDPASYKLKWHLDDDDKGLRVIDILRDLDDPMLVDLYGDLSNWIHWNAKGIAPGLKREGDVVRINWSQNHWGSLALAAGFQALFQSLEVLSAHLHLGYAERLTGLRKRYVEALS
jgi:hypothetical protein